MDRIKVFIESIMLLAQPGWFMYVISKIKQSLLTNVIFYLILVSAAFGQSSDNYLQVSSSITNYNLSTAAGLENIQTQTNAFRIILKSRYNNYYVSARISNYSSSNGVYLPETMLAIKLNSVSPSRTANYNTIYVSPNDQQIITGPSTGTQAYTYSYNMLFGPVGYDFAPGTYNVTILFTLSQY